MSDRSNTWVLATGNAGKVREFQQRLAPLGIRLLPQTDFFTGEVEETGLTFIENAILKARAVARVCEYPVLADDSGLRVDALGGAPGVFSARYAGEPRSDERNNAALLEALNGETCRTASFCCALALMHGPNDPLPMIVQAQWHGEILEAPLGEDGFGYDPLFWVPERACSSAQLSPGDKNRLSHRGRAIDLLLAQLDRPADLE